MASAQGKCEICEEINKKDNKSNKNNIKPPVDIFRDTPVRLLGYANEVGEAFRAKVSSSVVWSSYGIASLYVIADTFDKGLKMNKKVWPDEGVRKKKVFEAVVDTLIWQSFASVIIPGFTINRICALSGYVLKKNSKLPSSIRKWTVVVIGLSSIPFIVKPIDYSVDYIMDYTIRKYFFTN